MNSKQMLNWSLIYGLLVVMGLIAQLFVPSFVNFICFSIVISTIFNVGSSIMKGIERMEKKNER